jgi:hypothetical protein
LHASWLQLKPWQQFSLNTKFVLCRKHPSNAIFHKPHNLASKLPVDEMLFVLQVACQATATVVFLDDKYRPVRVPGSVKELFSKLHAEYRAPAEQ